MIIDRVRLFMNFPNGIFHFKIKRNLFDFKLYAFTVPEIFNIREKSKIPHSCDFLVIAKPKLTFHV